MVSGAVAHSRGDAPGRCVLARWPALWPQADFRAGLEAYQRGDYATALRAFRPLAEQGDTVAQNKLGWMYANGRGVPPDYREAVKWYRKAAEQGHATAALALTGRKSETQRSKVEGPLQSPFRHGVDGRKSEKRTSKAEGELSSAQRRIQDLEVQLEQAQLRAAKPSGDNKFKKAKNAFANRFHPDKSSGSAIDKVVRQEIFKEYWDVLNKIERGDT